MSDELIELDFCCPECHCSQWEQDKDAGIYSCGRCGYVIGFDEDDPDYDELPICPKCNSESITLDPIFGYSKCSSCFTAWVDDADDPDRIFGCHVCGCRFLEWNLVGSSLYCPKCKSYSHEQIR